MKMINTLLVRPTLRGLVLALAVSALSSQVAQAHPYATGITNTGGTVSFILNETADTVGVYFPDNGSTNYLGANLAPGVHTFTLGPGTNHYVITVKKVGSGTPSLMSVDTNKWVNFFGPRGVTVNRSPKTANFGRVYVAVGSGGTQPLGGVSSTNGTRVTTRGVYAINADQTDAVGQGDTAKTFGMTFAASTTYSPHKLSVGPDDMVYVGDGAGSYPGVGGITNGVYMVKPDLSSGVNLFPIDGTVPEVCGGVMGAPFAFGSYAAGTLGLYVVSWDLFDPIMGYQTIWLYTNFTTLPFTSAPQPVCNAGIGSVQGVYGDFTIGPDGKFYCAEPRATPAAGNAPIHIYDSTGANLLWDSWDNWNPAGGDPYTLSRSVVVSDDGKMMITHNSSTGNFTVIQLTNGIPDTGTFTLVTTGFGATSYGLALDAANNVYLTSSGLGILRVYSLGMTTTAITSNDATTTNGTFQLISPATTVSVTAADSTIFEAPSASPRSTVFTITRANANNDYSSPLVVNYKFTGTATSNAYYTVSANSPVTLAAGQLSTNITITAVHVTAPLPALSAILNLVGGGAYSTVAPRTAEVDIVNGETPQLQISALSTNIFEGNPYDYARATITRWGDSNTTLVVDTPNFTYGGTAASNVDYYVTNLPVTFNPGDLTQTIQLLYPINNNSFDLAKTITVGMVAGTGYSVSNSTFTTTLTEATLPTETVVWSDNLHSDTSTNWTALFGSPDPSSADYTTNWAYDYSADGIPPAPHSGGDTHGLRMTVNKGGSGQAAGLNFYPNGRAFSNNYALRFDMYLTEGFSFTTEYAIFGINHSGTKTNWFRNSALGVPPGTLFDGLWYDVEADGAALGDYVLYSSPTVTNSSLVVFPTNYASRAASTLTGVFKSPPYTVGAVGGGTPANLSGSTTPSWVQVEISQIGKVITLKMNNAVIMSYTNTLSYTNGNIMLGYCDGYDSTGTLDASVIYANVQVVQIGLPTITTQPANAVTPVGGSTNFTVVASTGTGLISYQWLLNGSPIANATNATLARSPVAAANYGTYSVNVFDGSYTTLSQPATLKPPVPVINVGPTTRAGAVGGSATFSVVATTYSGTTNYQWLTNNVPISGKTAATLVMSPLVYPANFVNYSVSVNDGVNTSITSAPVQLTVAARQSLKPSISGSTMNIGFNTEIGPAYVVEWKGALTNGAWNQLKTNAGTGGSITVTDSPTTAAARFYRVRMQ